MASVGISGLYKSFEGHVAAVSDLSLEIPDGEFLVLVGPSGCGKTTTLRMVAGLELPTAGRIRIGERDVTDLPPQERDVAMVFQSYALYPHMTVAENLGFGLRMRKVPKRDVDRRIRDVAEALGLRELLARKPAALSGGQRQRVALGRAIVREPQLFLFDEPLSNLDAKLRVHTRAELIRLHRQLGATMMYVTHDQVEAMTMGERIAVLNAGVLQQVAPPLELYDRPANLFVAGFIGSPPMNFFAGMLTQNGNAMRFAGRGIDIACADARTRAGDAVLGVRPEHCELTSIESGDVAIGVRVVEPLGSETLVHGRTEAGEDVVVRSLERPDLTPDARVGVRFDRARMHLFDAASGDRLERI